MMRRSRFVWALSLAVVSCGHGGGEEGAGGIPAVVGARTARAAIQPFTQIVNVLGVVSARPGTYAALSAPAATRTARVLVSVGQRVDRGAPLIEFERGPFEAAARSAEAALTAAQRTHDRAARLAEAGILPRKELDLAATELAQAEAAAITARRAQELATLTAPVAGVVTRMEAVVGAPVEVNQTLVEVADPAALDVVFNLSPAEAALVRIGQGITLTVGAGPGDSLGTGIVTGVAFQVDSASRSVAVRARLTRPSPALRIGATVAGQIAVGVREHAVTVPAEALVPDGEGFKVFVVDSSGIAHTRAVGVGSRTEGQVEITSGLLGGETVVTYGAYGVEDSAKIIPLKP